MDLDNFIITSPTMLAENVADSTLTKFCLISKVIGEMMAKHRRHPETKTEGFCLNRLLFPRLLALMSVIASGSVATMAKFFLVHKFRLAVSCLNLGMYPGPSNPNRSWLLSLFPFSKSITSSKLD